MATKRVRKEAAQIRESEGQLSDVAYEKQLDFICNGLRQDNALGYTIGSLMQDGVLGQILNNNTQKDAAAHVKAKRLSINCKKLKHLKGTMLQKVERVMEPQPELTEEWFTELPAGVLIKLETYGLNVTVEGNLPREWWPQCTFVDGFLYVCAKWHAKMGSRLAGVGTMAVEQVSARCYYKLEDATVSCPLFPEVEVAVHFSEGAEATITNAGEQDAKLKVPTLKQTADLKELFLEKTCVFMVENARWELDGIEAVAPDADACASSSTSTSSAPDLSTPLKHGKRKMGSGPSQELPGALLDRLQGSGGAAGARPPA